MKLAVEDRKLASQELAAEGESTRDIGAMLGVSKDTVQRALVSNETEDDTSRDEEASASVSNETPSETHAANGAPNCEPRLSICVAGIDHADDAPAAPGPVKRWDCVDTRGDRAWT